MLVASWSRHALSEISVHDLASGALLASVELPGLGTVGGLSERPEGGHEAWFGYTDYTTPPVVLRLDAREESVHTWAPAPGSPPAISASARQLTYRSDDGTEVRLLIISDGSDSTDDGDSSDGGARAPRPAILGGYGGFGRSRTPGYSANILAWVSAGGVYAVANLRGGGEEGEQWHRDGMLGSKQNVFDDFHAAARTLIDGGWTSPGRKPPSGAARTAGCSSARLPCGKPALFASVVCSAPLLDMVRYERFGLGETWNTEYGTASDPEQLRWLLSYSPYHHVAEGTSYPAVLFTVFTNDSRSGPHARLQDVRRVAACHRLGRPVLLRAWRARPGTGLVR